MILAAFEGGHRDFAHTSQMFSFDKTPNVLLVFNSDN